MDIIILNYEFHIYFQVNHTLKPVEFNDKILKLLEFDDDDYNEFNKTLKSILIPRVPGTEGHESVKKVSLV